MSDPKFRDIGSPVIRVIEESSELAKALCDLIHILCKTERFGWFNFHPDTPERTNWEQVRAGMSDVVEACERLEVQMRQIKFDQKVKR